jgi:hypothetical protein
MDNLAKYLILILVGVCILCSIFFLPDLAPVQTISPSPPTFPPPEVSP